jgi:kumamolisin
LTPPQVAQLYNFPSGTGLGQTIGIYDWGGAGYGYDPGDVSATLGNWGISAPAPTDFPPGSNNPANNGYYEPIIDISAATVIAPKATIVV